MELSLSSPSSKTFSLPGWFIPILLAITSIMALLLSWKTNGVLENTMRFDMYPLGYAYHYMTENFDIWPLNKEADFYLQSLQGFLKGGESYVNVGSGYEITRTMYPFALQSFWFFEPVIAFLIFDILMWSGAILCAFYVASVCGGKHVGYFAAFFTLLGHGFLLSIGEGVGHVWGYVGGFYIVALMVYLRTWESSCGLSVDALVYALICVLILGYGTALFYLPVALCSTCYRLYYQTHPLWHKLLDLFLLMLVAFLPVFILGVVSRQFGLAGDSGFLIQRLLDQNASFTTLIKDYVFIFVDVILSLGPLYFVFFPVSIFVFFSTSSNGLRAVIALVWMQFAAMALVLLPVPGRGYAAFNLAVLVIVFMSLYLHKLWVNRMFRLPVVLFLVVYALYPFSTLWGVDRMTNQMFQVGLEFKNQVWQGYDIVILQ